jgi:hypothetical protein
MRVNARKIEFGIPRLVPIQHQLHQLPMFNWLQLVQERRKADKGETDSSL